MLNYIRFYEARGASFSLFYSCRCVLPHSVWRKTEFSPSLNFNCQTVPRFARARYADFRAVWSEQLGVSFAPAIYLTTARERERET